MCRNCGRSPSLRREEAIATDDSHNDPSGDGAAPDRVVDSVGCRGRRCAHRGDHAGPAEPSLSSVSCPSITTGFTVGTAAPKSETATVWAPSGAFEGLLTFSWRLEVGWWRGVGVDVELVAGGERRS